MTLPEELLSYLKHRKETYGAQPISGAALASIFALAGSEAVRQTIHLLRSQGHWIASTNSGYFFANTWEEIEPTILSLKGRARAIAIPANAMLAKYPTMQMSLGE